MQLSSGVRLQPTLSRLSGLLDDFPLAWRWSTLPATTRAQIEPLAVDIARSAHDHAVHLWKPRGPIRHWDVIEFADIPESMPATWLRGHIQSLRSSVVVSWNPETAASVPQELFLEHWRTFCYPSSDDVFILPRDECWLLVYRHWEQFEFGALAV